MTGTIRPSIESFGYGPGYRPPGFKSAAASSSNIPVEKKKHMNRRGQGLTYRSRLAQLRGDQVVDHRSNNVANTNEHNDDEGEATSWSLDDRDTDLPDDRDLPMDAFGECPLDLSISPPSSLSLSLSRGY
jgi:hypothetical protein